MALPFDLPPVIAGLRNSEHSLYLRSGPRRRVRLLCEYLGSRSGVFNVSDMVALAVEEAKAAYNGQLPPGQYSNVQGHYFEVDRYGQPQTFHWSRPQCGLNWLSGRPLQQPPRELLPDYQFAAGNWGPIPPTEVYQLPFQCAAQQPQVPAFLPGSQLGGLAPPMYQQQQPLAGGNCFGYAAPHQQYPFAAMQMQPSAALDPAFELFDVNQQPFLAPAADEQFSSNTAFTPGEPTFLPFSADEPMFSLPAAEEQIPFFSAADEQSPSPPPSDDQSSLSLDALLQQYGPSPVVPGYPAACDENGDFYPWALDALLQESSSTPVAETHLDNEAAMCV